jgi:hypothetical protein
MPQINRLDWARIEKAIVATQSVVTAIKVKPSGHYTTTQLKSELSAQFGGGRIGQQIVLDAINRLQERKQISFQRKAGKHYMYLASTDTVAA